MAREWDAQAYAALDLPHVAWGRRVLDRMTLRGDETVLDAGCGTGRDGAALLERWPGVRLIALDGSQQMLDVAAETLPADRVSFVHADLTSPIPVAEPVDAVMSVAAFHWIVDHQLLFDNLAAVLRPGGRLTTDCGGLGNVANLDRALLEVTGQHKVGTHFQGVEDTETRLEAAGFDVEQVSLRPSPFRIDDRGVFERYLEAVCLGGQLAELPEGERDGFVTAVAEAFDEPVLDYVRLEIDAVRR